MKFSRRRWDGEGLGCVQCRGGVGGCARCGEQGSKGRAQVKWRLVEEEVQFGVPLIWRAVSDKKAPTRPSPRLQREHALFADLSWLCV